jgi:hypothetical protein
MIAGGALQAHVMVRPYKNSDVHKLQTLLGFLLFTEALASVPIRTLEQASVNSDATPELGFATRILEAVIGFSLIAPVVVYCAFAVGSLWSVARRYARGARSSRRLHGSEQGRETWWSTSSSKSEFKSAAQQEAQSRSCSGAPTSASDGRRLENTEQPSNARGVAAPDI